MLRSPQAQEASFSMQKAKFCQRHCFWGKESCRLLVNLDERKCRRRHKKQLQFQILVLLHVEAHLGSLLVLATCITAFSNECTFKFEEERLNNSHYVCRDDNGKIRIRNTKWMTDNCERCTCEPGGIKCCKTYCVLQGEFSASLIFLIVRWSSSGGCENPMRFTEFIYLSTTTKSNAKPPSTRRSVSTLWWNAITQKSIVQSMPGRCSVLLWVQYSQSQLPPPVTSNSLQLCIPTWQ
ncbi:uncharacterized protein LOC104861247 [Fukomys damarensis]|uniref:uncharacterized protein LOC104861247 n=1 Tax=Fukomys damarensis TaxID=885580 RepID=UPI0008FEC1EE|nr:uncharacterized protein LOC104861247 [Fukomys damarensis]